MTYRVVFSRRAVEDLEAAYQWYARQTPANAERWYNGFLKAIESLAFMPERCGLAPEDSLLDRRVRQLLYGRHRSYRAIFTVEGDCVVILHIRHTARQDASREDLGG